jgi:predicted secreted protein
LLASADYTASNGTTVVLASGAAANDIFTAVAYDSATQITQGDTAVEVSDTGSDGTITGTADNTAVFSVEKGKTFVLQGGVSSTGVGIAFPADQTTVGASSDANTLDDYEEGTWTPGVFRLVGPPLE